MARRVHNGFGASTSTVSVSSNGVLFFGQDCDNWWVNSSLPANITNDAALFFFWDDLNDYGGGEFIEYATLGTAPARVFYMYFRNRIRSLCGEDKLGIMISVREGQNLVNVAYEGITGCAQIRGGSATFGLQTTGGSAAKAVNVGTNAFVLDDNSNRQSMSFHPPHP